MLGTPYGAERRILVLINACSRQNGKFFRPGAIHTDLRTRFLA